MLAVDIFF